MTDKLHASLYDLGRDVSVPCNGCTACCYHAVPLLPGDKPGDYDTVQETDPRTGAPVLILKRREDGSCVYLGKL